MGKEYFEFLEEEFQGLTSQVQEALKQCAHNDSARDSAVDIPLLFTRCHAIYQQMRAEARSSKARKSQQHQEFRDRLTLYSIQMTALLEYYQSSQFDEESAAARPSKSSSSSSSSSRTPRKELTYTFTIDEDNML